jgi:hypothetical protein
MITINLLPEEFRRKARTPLKLMAALSVAVAGNASLLAWWCWMAFGVAAEIETNRSVQQMEMDGLTPQVNYNEALTREVAYHSSRETTLATITANRVQWTRMIDELIDVVAAGGDGVNHYIWFDDLNVKQEAPRAGGRGRGTTRQSYGTMKANGHSGSAAYDQVPAFLTDLADIQLTPLMASFYAPSAPEGTINDADDTLIPAVNWSFPLTLELRPPEERAVVDHKIPVVDQKIPEGK